MDKGTSQQIFFFMIQSYMCVNPSSPASEDHILQEGVLLFPATLTDCSCKQPCLGEDTSQVSRILQKQTFSCIPIRYSLLFQLFHPFENYKFQMSPRFVEAGVCSSISHSPYCFWVISKRRRNDPKLEVINLSHSNYCFNPSPPSLISGLQLPTPLSEITSGTG